MLTQERHNNPMFFKLMINYTDNYTIINVLKYFNSYIVPFNFLIDFSLILSEATIKKDS